MAKEKDNKTNVMRVLDSHGISYTAHTYPRTAPSTASAWPPFWDRTRSASSKRW